MPGYNGLDVLSKLRNHERLRYIPITIPLPPPQDPELAFATRTVQSDFYKFNI